MTRGYTVSKKYVLTLILNPVRSLRIDGGYGLSITHHHGDPTTNGNQILSQ